MTHALLFVGILVASLVLAARRPEARLLVILGGAGVSSLAASLLGLGTTRELLADVPWDVLVILVTLGLLSEAFVEGRLFAVVAVRAAQASGATRKGLVLVFGVAMYLVSATLNNLTALVLVLPVVLVVFRVVGVEQRQASWTLGTLLVACNLGGAATPIGDFPAILLLARGAMGFTDYLARAMPATILGLLGVLALATWRVARGRAEAPLGPAVSLALLRSLHRGIRLDLRLVVPLGIAFGLMVVAWVVFPAESGITADLVAWLGVLAALAYRPALGERLVRTRVDVEAALFLLGLFVMVVAVRRTGVFADVGAALVALPVSPALQLVVFLVAATAITGVFSAGPAMAALLEVAATLATVLPSDVVYVGLALAVCAGSSSFLTAATAGPLAQSLVERSGVTTREGTPLRFGFAEFLPVGLAQAAILLAVAIGYTLFGLARAG